MILKRYNEALTESFSGESVNIMIEHPHGEWVKHDGHLASIADAERKQGNYQVAYEEWELKTRWVQDDPRFDVTVPWGKHRADVLREYIDHLEARIATLERETAEAMEVVREANAVTERVAGEFAAMTAELKQSQIDVGCYKHGMEASNARLIQVAAELSAFDAVHDDAVFITDDHYDQCPPEVQKIIRTLAVMQIPAYKSFLAEVQAQGVDIMVTYHMERAEALKEVDRMAAFNHSNAALDASSVAAQLRQPSTPATDGSFFDNIGSAMMDAKIEGDKAND